MLRTATVSKECQNWHMSAVLSGITRKLQIIEWSATFWRFYSSLQKFVFLVTINVKQAKNEHDA